MENDRVDVKGVAEICGLSYDRAYQYINSKTHTVLDSVRDTKGKNNYTQRMFDRKEVEAFAEMIKASGKIGVIKIAMAYYREVKALREKIADKSLVIENVGIEIEETSKKLDLYESEGLGRNKIKESEVSEDAVFMDYESNN